MNNTRTKEDVRKGNEEYLWSFLREMLAIAGWSERSAKKSLLSEHKGKMRLLSEKAVQIQETIGRGIISMDLKVEIIACDSPFDPAKMDDADGQRGGKGTAPSDTVACTIELGLGYRKSVEGSDEVGISLKPKVLLASFLEEVNAPDART